jgi:CheY-like chemotaxis protein
MTVGIAALAARRRAILLIADKQFTDEASGLRVGGHDLKAFQLVNGWIVLYAGDPTFATIVVHRAENQLRAGAVRLTDAVVATNWLRDAYLAVYEEEVDRVVFRPRFLDRARFLQRAYDEATIRDIEARPDRFQVDGTCELLICGFDGDDEGQVIKVAADLGDITDSHASIGSGAPFADAHLAWRRTQSSDSADELGFNADVVVIDLNLGPGIRGDQFAAEYRRRAKGPARIVVLSGVPMAHELGLAIGAAAILPKPYDVDELVSTIRVLSPRRDMGSADQ